MRSLFSEGVFVIVLNGGMTQYIVVKTNQHSIVLRKSRKVSAVLVQSAFKKHMCFFVLLFDQPLFYVLFCAFFWP